MKLSTWIDNKGGTIAVSKLLGVTRGSVYTWRVGKCFPRASVLKQLREKSNFKITYEEMVDEFIAKQALRKKRKVVPRARKKPKVLNTRKAKAEAVIAKASKPKASQGKAARHPGF